MTKLRKYLLPVLFLATGLYTLTLLAALLAEKNIHSKYDESFNTNRIKLGIPPVQEFQTTHPKYWKDLHPERPVSRWIEILTNEEIVNSITYTNQQEGEKPFHQSKEVIFETRLCFWQNFYAGEIDIFVKSIDKNQRLELIIAYFSENMEPGNYFYINLDTIHSNRPGLTFVTDGFDPEGHVSKGNTSKKQADELLLEWGVLH